MPVHPHPAPVQQDRTLAPLTNSAFHGSCDRRRERGENDLAAFAPDLQDPVAVLLAKILNVSPAGFENPKPEKAEHRDQREVVPVQ